jgi:hypothetical protein
MARATFPTDPPIRNRDQLCARIGCEIEDLLPLVSFDGLGDALFASGSIVEGLGNSSSDIDIIRVRPPGLDCADRSVDFWYWSEGGRWVDVETYSHAAASRTARRINANGGGAPSSWSEQIVHRSATLVLYHRLLIAIGLTANATSLAAGWRLRRWVFSRELAYSRIVSARSSWVDAVGAFSSKHYQQAVVFAFRTLESCVDAYTALLGQLNPAPKWRWARLARLRQDPLGVRSLPELCLAPLASTDARDAGARIECAAELLLQVIHASVHGHFIEPSHDLGPLSRYELLHGETVIVNADGSIRPASVRFRGLDGSGQSMLQPEQDRPDQTDRPPEARDAASLRAT